MISELVLKYRNGERLDICERYETALPSSSRFPLTRPLDDPKLAETIGKADVVVYSTGADEVRNLLLKRTPTAEFRHTPDPHALQDILLPLLESLRRRK